MKSRNKQDEGYRPYVPPKSATWWLRKRSYFMFMMRELSSVFIALFLLFLLYKLFLSTRNEIVFSSFESSLESPVVLFFYGVAFLFSLYHSITWLSAMGDILLISTRKGPVPSWLLTTCGFVMWCLASLAIFYYFVEM